MMRTSPPSLFQDKIQQLFVTPRQDVSQMTSQTLPGLLGSAVGGTSLPPKTSLGGGKQCPTPSILPAMTVYGIDKVFYHHTARHLQAPDIGIKFAPHIFAHEVTGGTQLPCCKATILPQGLQDHVVQATFLWQREAMPAIVTEIRPPVLADETSLPIYELTVSAAAFPYHLAFPFPHGPFPPAIRQRGVLHFLAAHLLGRPPIAKEAQERKNAQFLHPLCQLGASVDFLIFFSWHGAIMFSANIRVFP